LRQQDEIVLTGYGADVDEALQKVASLPVDVVLIDAAADKQGAIKNTWKIKRELPDVKVVILGLAQNEKAILDFIEAGANGYVLKESPLSELLGVITAVNNKEMPCSPAVVASVFLRLSQLSRENRRRQIPLQTKLTQREREILRLVAADLGNKEIAQQLNLSLSTVKNHVHNILKKLQVHHRRGAGHYVQDVPVFERTLAQDFRALRNVSLAR
jgi:RNA polymerase sigma factor (sigma-70 family)